MRKRGRPFGAVSAPYAAVSKASGVYLIEIDGAAIKVGFSRCMRKRITQHARTLARCGATITKLEIYERLSWADEQQCIHRLGQHGQIKAGTLETFTGLSFDAAREVIKQTVAPP